jgi:hypothetical protein
MASREHGSQNAAGVSAMNHKLTCRTVAHGALALSTVLLLAGCGGRPANPVQTVQATDASVPCAVLRVEYDSNEARARSLVSDKQTAENQNVALAAVGLLLAWPALLAMDLKPTEKVELRALRDRNQHILNLMKVRNCPQTPELKPSPVKGTGVVSRDAGGQPYCRDVGGYEAYMKKTGEVCRIN